MVVTTNIKLERILLHSLATSSVSPGTATKVPSWLTGMPAMVNSSTAADADPCCSKYTMWCKANSGMGTSHKQEKQWENTAPENTAAETTHERPNPPRDNGQHLQRQAYVTGGDVHPSPPQSGNADQNGQAQQD